MINSIKNISTSLLYICFIFIVQFTVAFIPAAAADTCNKDVLVNFNPNNESATPNCIIQNSESGIAGSTVANYLNLNKFSWAYNANEISGNKFCKYYVRPDTSEKYVFKCNNNEDTDLCIKKINKSTKTIDEKIKQNCTNVTKLLNQTEFTKAQNIINNIEGKCTYTITGGYATDSKIDDIIDAKNKCEYKTANTKIAQSLRGSCSEDLIKLITIANSKDKKQKQTGTQTLKYILSFKDICEQNAKQTQACCSNSTECNGMVDSILGFTKGTLNYLPGLYASFLSTQANANPQDFQKKHCNANNIHTAGSTGADAISAVQYGLEKTCISKVESCKKDCDSEIQDFKKDFYSCFNPLTSNTSAKGLNENIESIMKYTHECLAKNKILEKVNNSDPETYVMTDASEPNMSLKKLRTGIYKKAVVLCGDADDSTGISHITSLQDLLSIWHLSQAHNNSLISKTTKNKKKPATATADAVNSTPAATTAAKKSNGKSIFNKTDNKDFTQCSKGWNTKGKQGQMNLPSSIPMIQTCKNVINAILKDTIPGFYVPENSNNIASASLSGFISGNLKCSGPNPDQSCACDGKNPDPKCDNFNNSNNSDCGYAGNEACPDDGLFSKLPSIKPFAFGSGNPIVSSGGGPGGGVGLLASPKSAPKNVRRFKEIDDLSDPYATFNGSPLSRSEGSMLDDNIEDFIPNNNSVSPLKPTEYSEGINGIANSSNEKSIFQIASHRISLLCSDYNCDQL